MLTQTAAIAFLITATPIAIWVAWSDMKFMKIPNKAVLALMVVFVVIGLITLPFKVWLWGLALFCIVLAVTFVANAAGLIGGGDAKFGAAMAPFFVGADPRLVMGLFAACLLAAFVSHRALGMIGPFRRATTDWASWTHKDFPMGLALGGALVFYLIVVLRTF